HSRNGSITTKNNPKHTAQGLVNNEVTAQTLANRWKLNSNLRNNSQNTGARIRECTKQQQEDK
ncbi:5561_t:CDS:2, partial [Gigaspora rosea]